MNQKAMNFAVTLNKVTSLQTITVNYSTENVTATAGSDYVAKSGTITFLPGIKKVLVNIPVIGDKTVESNETFRVILSNPVNAAIAKAASIGTIINDDGAAIASVATKASATAIRAVKISPNPANSVLKVELSGYTGNVALQLISMDGKMLLEKKMQAVVNFAKEQINVSAFASGTYLLIVTDDNNDRKIEKVIIER